MFSTMKRVIRSIGFGLLAALVVGTSLGVPLLFVPEPTNETSAIISAFTVMAFWCGFFIGWAKDALDF